MKPLRILQISPQVPLPLSDGGKVAIFNTTKYLARRGHELTMLAFHLDRSVNPDPMREYCQLIAVPHSNKDSLYRAGKNLFTAVPYGISKYRSPIMLAKLENLLASRTFDVVHVDHLHMAHYGVHAKRSKGLPVLLREHNVESTIVERFADSVRIPVFRQWMQLQKRRIKKYEAERAGQCDLNCTVTAEDSKRLLTLLPSANVRDIPEGIAEEFFQTVNREPIPKSICLFGSFDWLPNRDSLSWFVEDIFPRVLERDPEITLYVVGKHSPKQYEVRYPGKIVIRGFAPDLKSELAQYVLTVVPLRIGAGIRMKILESFAMGLPVVSTSIGAEGIKANHGEHLSIGDTPTEFAEGILRMLEDSDFRSTVQKNAKHLADQNYRWEHVAYQLENAYREIMDGHPRERVAPRSDRSS